ncbi:MDR family MFS transporter [Alkalicoccobacillus plakortidis]|uniref:MFS transporter n=1 Tax=Alkalicoccobacillus plakortidis TaxID=444060 RepID=A0ABT0XML0_9BACI|nr:MDR family MFS transporter [Alkalicoccobacillus plakortidis]MCM2677147.1 MFS transporter [Alkalicoccobacillus plakortidis]
MTEPSRNKYVVAGLLLGIFMAAIDNTIVATAMGTIVSDLGSYEKFVWVTAGYMVAVMVGMPIYGKLSDMYGRKRFFLFGLLAFLLGSILCGTAQSMDQLIAYRVIQGIGGGALMPIAFTIIFDLFPPEKRGKMTGLFGAVFGLSSVLGPLLGAFITDTLSWNWVFYINIPIGAIAFFLILRHYQEERNTAKQKIDWLGASTLVIAIVCLMFALELGGKTYAWSSTPILLLFSMFGAMFTAFFFVERKASEPIISFWMFKNRLFATSQILAFLYGGTFIILAVFVPIYVQAVYGGTATSAGFILMPMMLGSVAGSMVGGMLQTKVTFRSLMAVSVTCFFIGMSLLSGMSIETSRVALSLYIALVGFGVGFSFSLLPAASINGISARFRGSANSTNSFLRSFGMTVGVTIYGTIQTSIFTSRLGQSSMTDSGNVSEPADIQQIFQARNKGRYPADLLAELTQAMSDSITFVFTLALVPIAIACVTVAFMGNTRVLTSKEMEDQAN